MDKTKRKKKSELIAGLKRGKRAARLLMEEMRVKLIMANEQHTIDQRNIEHLQTLQKYTAQELGRYMRIAQMRKSLPKIVCLCGSTRFIETFAILAWELERDNGCIVLGLHYLPPTYPDVMPDHMAEAEGVAQKMDDLHKRKIDLADEIFVVNVGGYIGDSTKSEIMYAIGAGKPVLWLEPDKQWKGQ